MLWTVRHLWPYGDHFVFNCYRHWSSIILQKGNRADSFLQNMEGVTQGDQLVMVAYGIGFLLLIKQLKSGHPDVTQPWYADYAVALGLSANIKLY